MNTFKYDVDFTDDVINTNIKRLTNQIYKLLPTREENGEWEKPLATIIEELAGMKRLDFGRSVQLHSLLCKLEGLFTLTQEEDFLLYRRVIFECLGLMKGLSCQDQII